ncbi:MAG: XdhC family protein [Archangium sp.]|nr:XdhC family protein [Archangium sp.]
MNELASIVKEGRLALSRGLPTVLATVVAVRGSAYRRPGARMLVTSEGWRAGSISGGCLEADVTRQAAFLVANGRALVRSYDTSEDAGARLGCGGEIDVLLEPLVDSNFLELLARVEERRETLTIRTALEGGAGEREVWVDGVCVFSNGPLAGRAVFEERVAPSQRLLIVGAGHDALPVARLAEELGWSVDVYDWRPGLLTKERFPTAKVTCVALDSLRFDVEPGTLAVVMAHHIDYDAGALGLLLRDERVLSVGLLGPRHRSGQVLALVEGKTGRLTEAQRARLRAPVGLDLGAEGPSAIALSILAEAQAVRAGRSGGFLSVERSREQPSHG